MKLNPNPIVQYLQKEPSQFTKSDIIKPKFGIYFNFLFNK